MSNQQKKWSAMSGLAGAAALASGSQAYATITPGAALPSPIPPPDGAFVGYSIDGNASLDIAFGTFAQLAPGGDWLAAAGIGGANFGGVNNQIIGYTVGVGTFDYVFKFAQGQSVGPALPPSAPGTTNAFRGGTASTINQITLASRYGGTDYGAFVGDGILGFRFLGASGIQYGWIKVNVTPTQLTFISSAFESTANTAIPAGVVPEPTSLAALAFGLGAACKRPGRRTEQ